MSGRYTPEDAAKYALLEGERLEEMGVRVSWPEVKALHKVIQDLLDERLTLQAQAWDAGYNQGFADGEHNVWNPQFERTDKNPHRQKEEQ